MKSLKNENCEIYGVGWHVLIHGKKWCSNKKAPLGLIEEGFQKV